MPKKKGVTILLDEDISSALLIDLLEWKGYGIELVARGAKDHLIRPRLAFMPFFTKDKGWLKAGAVPRHHGGVVVFDAGHLNDEELATLVLSFVTGAGTEKGLFDALIGRRFLHSPNKIEEYGRDGTVTNTVLR